MSLEHHFLEFVRKSDSVEEAWERATMATAIEFGEMVDEGVGFAEALKHCGIDDPDSLRRIEVLSTAEQIDYRPPFNVDNRVVNEEKLKKAPTITGAFYIIVVGGGVKGVPSPECMNTHLPPRGRRTRDDYEKAWKECTK